MFGLRGIWELDWRKTGAVCFDVTVNDPVNSGVDPVYVTVNSGVVTVNVTVNDKSVTLNTGHAALYYFVQVCVERYAFKVGFFSHLPVE